MSGPDLDDIDHAILDALREDARHNSNAAISDRVDLSASSVGKRIARLEESGVLRGYAPSVDYERAGFDLNVLFVCTAPIADRERLAERCLELDGVVTVRELMSGTENLHVQAVAGSSDEITQIAHRFDEMGLVVTDEILLRREYACENPEFERAE